MTRRLNVIMIFERIYGRFHFSILESWSLLRVVGMKLVIKYVGSQQAVVIEGYLGIDLTEMWDVHIADLPEMLYCITGIMGRVTISSTLKLFTCNLSNQTLAPSIGKERDP